MNQINITKNNISLQKAKLISSIEAITNIRLDDAISMEEALDVKVGEFASLQPIKKKINASRLGIKAEKEKLYPSITAHGNYYFSTEKSYNNNKDVNEKYGNIGIVLNIPLLSMSQYKEIEEYTTPISQDNFFKNLIP